jgi:hypothetical protein
MKNFEKKRAEKKALKKAKKAAALQNKSLQGN